MVKVRGPMFSVTASGTVGDAIEFMTWKGSAFRKEYERAGMAYVRGRVLPLVPKTTAVVAIRRTLGSGVSTYQDSAQVAPEYKQSWDSVASGTGMSGFNRYLQAFIECNPQRQSPWNIPPVKVMVTAFQADAFQIDGFQIKV